ncbi:hypothetical protein EIP91_004128 [Steccherinum ochraceum]|uniref:Cytochrome P450 n=1 Tax=Steccherinum ochraceum TaxID=92696 RepID=A0A4R0R9A7_9APHY|nr:hypothetical protein EIP91_004128 [Steccherinum ochraceum]
MVKLTAWDWAFSIMPYNERWRTLRRHFHEHYTGPALLHYQPVQLQEVRGMLQDVLNNPTDTRRYIRRVPGATIIRVTYGARNETQTQEYIDLAEKALEAGKKMAIPGAFYAEAIPLLKYIPAWLPGGYARKFAAVYRPVLKQMIHKPYDEVKDAMASGRELPSVAYNLISQFQSDSEPTPEEDSITRDVTAMAYVGAVDTTTAAIEFAGYLETLRSFPITPLAVPHTVTEDDEYQGFRIPKDTTIIPNVWAMLNDPEDYPDPFSFKPERFVGDDGQINPAVRNPRDYLFGFGRRVCPGSEFAIALTELTVASLLHVFDIEAGADERGVPVSLTTERGNEAICYPETFPRVFKPRSVEAEKMIQALEHDQTLAD